MFSGGNFTLGRVRGAPIRMHWSTPLGALVFTGFSLNPLAWAGVVLLILVHELGHAALVWRLGDRVTSIQLHAFGGSCAWAGDPTRAERALVAWGGVMAQGALWLVATAILWLFGPPPRLLEGLALAFTSANLGMVAFNLLPIPPLDGSEAWPLLPMLWESRREQRDYQRKRAKDRRRTTDEHDAERRAAIEEELAALDRDDAPPVPSDVQAVLDRIAREQQKKTPR